VFYQPSNTVSEVFDKEL